MSNSNKSDDNDAPGSKNSAYVGGKRGFASMPKEKQKAIASQGGKEAHRKGRAHEFTPDEARNAGRKGGLAVSQNREHMSAIGREGGKSRGRNVAERLKRERSGDTSQTDGESSEGVRPGDGDEHVALSGFPSEHSMRPAGEPPMHDPRGDAFDGVIPAKASPGRKDVDSDDQLSGDSSPSEREETDFDRDMQGRSDDLPSDDDPSSRQ